MFTGRKYLINTKEWFISPDGINRKAVWGTVHESEVSSEVIIGNMTIHTDQILNAIETDIINFDTVNEFDVNNGLCIENQYPFSRIYNADQS